MVHVIHGFNVGRCSFRQKPVRRGIGELAAACQLDMTLLMVMVQGDHWDVFLGVFSFLGHVL